MKGSAAPEVLIRPMSCLNDLRLVGSQILTDIDGVVPSPMPRRSQVRSTDGDLLSISLVW